MRTSFIGRLSGRLRRRPEQPEFGIWEAHTNLIANGAMEAGNGWFPAKVSFKGAFDRQPGKTTVRLGGDINQMAVLEHPLAGTVNIDELWRTAREYVETGRTFSPTALTGDAIATFFRFCDMLRERGQTVGVLTAPVWVGLRRIPKGSECEMVASFTDGRSILKHDGREFEVYFDQHHLTWRWNDSADLTAPTLS